MLIILVVIVNTAVVTFLAVSLAKPQKQEPLPQQDMGMRKYQRFEELYAFIDENYIGEIDESLMLDAALKAYVAATGDVYSMYFTPEEYAEFIKDEEGEYVGIGVVVNTDTEDNLLTVAQVYSNSPARDAGMQIGDKIMAVDGEDVTTLDYMVVVDMVRGIEGTQVTLTILRDGEFLDLTMTRATVIAERVEWRMLEDKPIGYIKIYEFNGNADEMFSQAVDDLLNMGAKGFVLDLRYNPGGSKDIVVNIADELFPKGPIITLEDNKGNQYVDSSDADYLNMPLAVLINEYSASASELLAGGIKDLGLGTLVGQTTFGKGVAQGFQMFEDGAVLRLTMNRYLTAGGFCPQDVGITPDIEVALDKAVEENTLLLGDPAYDNQMQAAIDALSDKID